jgi:collagenase-like PrtC family protease
VKRSPQWLSMPADFSPRTLDAYALLNKKYGHLRVAETYGNLNPGHPLLGTGRTEGGLPRVNPEQLRKTIEHGKSLGIGFNYTLNSRCTGNLEFGMKGRQELLSHVEELMRLGVGTITVALPSVLRLLRAQFPELRLCVSVITGVRSVKQAALYKGMGADRIILAEDIYRDFRLIERIRRGTGIPVELIVNTRCIFQCPYRKADYGLLAHCAAGRRKLPIHDYYKWLCTEYLFVHPIEFMKMRWIRPEDLAFYEAVDLFKVIGRQLVADANLPRVAETYMRGSFDGNLTDLLGTFSPRRLDFYPVRIENRALDGFLSFFRERKCAERACNDCRHCAGYLERAVGREDLERLEVHAREYATALHRYARDLDLGSVNPTEVAFAMLAGA